MTNICLIRHGETDWNVLGKIQGKTDIPLNANGMQQASMCREYLKAFDWDVVVTSPLIRAKKTAEIINESLQLKIIEMEEFKEKSFGDAEGKTREEREKLYPNLEYPNQESRSDLIDRIMAGLEKILSEFPNQKVLLVAHGAVIHTLLHTLLEDQSELKSTYLKNACISNIFYQENRWSVKNYNIIDHLSI
ncbi:histidine phosphatase family protein [Niallia sp. NCCP-28]|uniref:histidine phosphatase family protein n=1 Tax=Niallia sp. NCCP-28 TaxID=2934712 RepID=UPI002081157A|nr:histidine phosphatase family protein [Niallia sp. NCCP-28]GKU84817.1 putative phosphatase PhoE [Niallia sp. NCCP-28]